MDRPPGQKECDRFTVSGVSTVCIKIKTSSVTRGGILNNTNFTNWTKSKITTSFNNMRTLKFKAQPTNAFFATVNQTFCGPSQLPATAEHCLIV